MNELDLNNIASCIYLVRNKQVMLARDVAKLYDVETYRINEVVKRNIKRFPESFCFQLTREECDKLCSTSQFAMLNKSGNAQGSNIKYLPYVFSEHGIMMLSGLLKSDIAVSVNIKIINALVAMRKLINTNFAERLAVIEQKSLIIDNRLDENDKKFAELFAKFKETANTNIFFEGKIYNAYSLMINILNIAKNNIIIIDNYIDKNLLDILANINKKVLIYTKNISKIDLKKYKNQYHNLKIKFTEQFHDRFIIIDKKILYHSGASFKDLGKKCFAINKIENKEILQNLLNRLNKKLIDKIFFISFSYN